VYDHSQSYVSTLWGLSAILLLGAVLTALMIKPWDSIRLSRSENWRWKITIRHPLCSIPPPTTDRERLRPPQISLFWAYWQRWGCFVMDSLGSDGLIMLLGSLGELNGTYLTKKHDRFSKII